jgi:hypothetical protein
VVASIQVTPLLSNIEIGETVQLQSVVISQAGTTMTGVTLTWTSSASSVATVSSSGLVTGLAAGNTTSSAPAQGKTGTASVTVIDPNPPEAPTDVSAVTVSDTEILVTWSDNSNNETGFEILREAVPSGVSNAGAGGAGATAAFVKVGEVGANVTSFRDTGLDPDTGYRYAVNACNANGCVEAPEESDDTRTNPTLVLITDELPNGTTETAYEATLQATGGDGSYVWEIASGELPDGLSLDGGSGTISGTPTVSGPFAFVVEVTSGDGQEDDQLLDITILEQILPPEIDEVTLPPGVVGTAYSQTLTASGGDGSFDWEVTSGDVPPGLTLDAATGEIGGTPTTAGQFDFEVTVTSAEMSDAADFSIQILDALEITTASDLPTAIVGEPYAFNLEATGGAGGYTWSVAVGATPAGVTLGADGSLTGTPTTVEEAVFTAEVTSIDGQVTDREFTLSVQEGLGITTTSLPNGVIGEAYSQTLGATGNRGPVTWSVSDGDLPDGLALDPGTGAIDGTPTAIGSFTFEVTARDDEDAATASYTVGIFDPLTISTPEELPNAIVGEAYTFQMEASGGDGSYSWSIVGGALADGLGLTGEGEIAGTTTEVELALVTIEVTSGDGQTTNSTFGLWSLERLVITTESLPDGEAGVAYSATLTAVGGADPYTWAVSEGDLPDGLTLDGETGEISGTPAGGGESAFTVQVVGAEGETATAEFTLTVRVPVVITTTSLPDGELGEAYSEAVEATGGDGTYAWAIESGSLPDGLSLDPGTGAITGTPTTLESATFTLGVTSDGASDSQELTITIVPAPVSLARTFLGQGYPGESFTATLSASGGDGSSFTFSLSQGTLPAGLTLNPSTGEIAGTPTTPGVAFLEFQAESGGATDTEFFTLAISNNPSTGFNMSVVSVSETIPSADIQASVDDAVARWEAAITGDLPAGSFLPTAFDSGSCGGPTELNGETVDDIVAILRLENIDGPGKILGSAGPCWVRENGESPNQWVTSAGILTLDTSDIGGWGVERRFNVIWHEVGHIMGIGTLWESFGNDLLTGDCSGGPLPEWYARDDRGRGGRRPGHALRSLERGVVPGRDDDRIRPGRGRARPHRRVHHRGAGRPGIRGGHQCGGRLRHSRGCASGAGVRRPPGPAG